MSCAHENIVDPPPGRHLRVCLDCVKRLIECGACDAIIVAGAPEGADWLKVQTIDGIRADGTSIVDTTYYCARCAVTRR